MLVVSILIYISAFLCSFFFARKAVSIKVIDKLPKKNIHLTSKQKKRLKKIRNVQLFKKFLCVLMMFLIPSLVASFRTSGVDYQTYKGIFNSINAGNRYPIEFGSLLTMFFLNSKSFCSFRV